MKKLFFFFAAMLVTLAVNATPIEPGTGTLKASIGAAADGAVIELNAGTYVEDSIDIYKNLTIKAADMNNMPIVKARALGISGDAAGVRVKFEGIKFDAQSVEEHLLYSYDKTNSGNKLILEGCEFYNYTPANSLIHVGKTEKLDACTINKCYIHDITGSFVFNENTSNAFDLTVTNSTFANIAKQTTYYAGVLDSRATSGTIRVNQCTFYNVQVINTDNAAVGQIKTSDAIVSNSIFAMPTAVDGVRAIRDVQAANNCLTYNYIKDSNRGIHSDVAKNNCIFGQDPKFIADSIAKGKYNLAEDSPAKGAGVGGTHLGDPRWWPASWQPAEVIPVESVTLDEEELAIDVNETAFLHATVLPNDATDPSVTWTSSDNAKATVTNGAVKGIAAGTVTITATAGSKSATCEVTVSDVIPSTDFAEPYFLKGTKAVLADKIYLSEADSLHYKDKSVCGTATWKINALSAGEIQVTANYKTGSASGAKLRIVILNNEEKQVGDTLKQAYYNEDGDVVIPGTIRLPEAGVYTVKLLNDQEYSSSKLNGITLTKTADLPTAAIKGGWDSWTSELAFTLSKDAKTASVKKTFNENDAYFFKILINGEYRGNGYWFKRDATTANITENTSDMKIIADYTGEYTFTWTFATNTLTVTFPAVPDPTFYVAGSFTDWETSKVKMTEEDGICTAAIHLAASTNTDFKILKIDYWGTKTWYGAQDADNHMTYESCTDWQLTTTNGNNINLQTTLEKDYTFTFNAATAKLSVDIPDPTTTSISNTAANAKAVKSIVNGQLLITRDGKTYNVLGTIVK